MKVQSETEISKAIESFLLRNMGVKWKRGESFAAMGVDSMAILKILLFLEKEFGIFVPDSELTSENIHDINTLSATAFKISSSCS